MDEFLTAAVVGTAHYKNALPITHSAVDTLTNQISTEQKERAFLLAAGARAIYLQAGNRASEATDPLTPAAPETLTACSEQVAHLILDLLLASNTILLPEALQRLHSAQLRVPHQVLPTCIIYGTQHKEYRADLLSVLGERGRWLSQFNTDWQWISDVLSETNGVLPADAETLWQEGRPEQRRELLQRLRAQDPEKARIWLEAVWPDEKAETRAAFLACLQEGLSSNDHAFIGQALEDRSEGVRQTAVSLIHLLPDSPQMQKMVTLISEMLDYKKSLLQQQLCVTLPQEVTLEWKSTIAISKLKQDDHDAAYWFHYGLSHIPPQHWEKHFSSTPETLIDVIENAPHGKEMLLDIMQAAASHGTISWYAPLLTWHIRMDPPQQLSNVCHSMLSALPPTTRESLIAPLQTDRAHWEQAIQLLPAPWSSTFSQQCLDMLINRAKENDPELYTFWARLLPLVALALHPSCFKQAQELGHLPVPEKSTWQIQQQQRHISAFIGLIQLRKRILEEI